MEVLIINQKEAHELLPVAECIDLMAETMTALARGETINPLRQIIRLGRETNDMLGVMPGALPNRNAAGVKIVSVFPGNKGSEHDSHQGAVLLIEMERGQLLAMIDASAITAIRTAAVSGLATRVLSRQDATELAVLGSGVQAYTHVSAVMAVRRIGRVRVWSPDRKRAEGLAQAVTERFSVPAYSLASAKEAVADAHIICTATSSREPILKGDWIAPGAHINAVGSSFPAARELDARAVAISRLFVDRRESTINESGDFLMAKRDAGLSDEHIQGEIGEIVAGQIDGRKTREEITLFKSLGLAIEDVAAAHYLYQKATEMGVGVSVEFGGSRILTF